MKALFGILTITLALSTQLQAQSGSGDGYIYSINASNSSTITITNYTGLGGAVIIPTKINNLTVTAIGSGCGDSGCDYVFGGTEVTSITIPNSVTSIGVDAFSDCANLTSVTIGNGVTSIGNFAFDTCTRLINITIGSNVTSIGEYAFQGCSELTGITIPSSVNSIGVEAFDSCFSMTGITVNAQNANYSSVNGVLFNNNQTTLVEYPSGLHGNYTIPSSVTSIGFNAFNGCWYLTSVTIPNSVISIGESAFDQCSPGLTNVTIGNGVTSIGENAFASCTGLTSVNIPNSLTSIGLYAFNGCTSLTSIIIPSSITSIQDYAFDYCTGLTSIYFQGNAPAADATVFTNDPNATAYYLPGTTGWGSTFYGIPTTAYKETPTVSTLPIASAITYGQTLSSSTLSGGSASVGGGFAFTSPTTLPSAGTSSQSVTFTPTDTVDYYTITTSMEVTVNKANATVTLGNLIQTYNGTAINVTVTTIPSGLTVSFTYNGSSSAPTNTGTYAVIGTINNANYLGSATNTLVLGIPPQSFSGISTNNNQLRLQLSGTPNFPYILQSTTNLTPPINWQDVLTNPADVNGNWSTIITNLQSVSGQFFQAVGQ